MGTALAVFEPICLPDPRRPTELPSLPGWVSSRLGSLIANVQPDAGTNLYRELAVLPADMMLSQVERGAIEDHVAGLERLLDLTPERSADIEAELLVLIVDILSAKGGAKNTEKTAEAKAKTYVDALDDVPIWAVRAAWRRWNRGEGGEDEEGRSYNYSFAPDSAVLRRLARQEMWKVKGRSRELVRLLGAQALIERCKDDFSDKRMEKALAQIIHMGANGVPGIREISIDEAAAAFDRRMGQGTPAVEAAPQSEAAE